MPARSQKQANLMRAAEHGATFPLAEKVRESMSHKQMHDFAVTPSKGLPVKVAKVGHPHLNLGKWLHPKKGR